MTGNDGCHSGIGVGRYGPTGNEGGHPDIRMASISEVSIQSNTLVVKDIIRGHPNQGVGPEHPKSLHTIVLK